MWPRVQPRTPQAKPVRFLQERSWCIRWIRYRNCLGRFGAIAGTVPGAVIGGAAGAVLADSSLNALNVEWYRRYNIQILSRGKRFGLNQGWSQWPLTRWSSVSRSTQLSPHGRPTTPTGLDVTLNTNTRCESLHPRQTRATTVSPLCLATSLLSDEPADGCVVVAMSVHTSRDIYATATDEVQSKMQLPTRRLTAPVEYWELLEMTDRHRLVVFPMTE